MWFTETPWPPVVLALVGAAFLLVAWSSRGQTKFLVGAVLLVLLCVVIYVVEGQIVTDAERVEASVHELCHAFQRKDEATYDYISQTAPEIKVALMGAMALVRVQDDLSVTDVSVEMLAQNSRALSHFRANATIDVVGYGNVGRQPSRWELTWQREDDEWKVIRVTRLHPITGEEMGLLERQAQ